MLTSSSNTDHEFQATEVTGIGGGPPMCETRFLNKQERMERGEREQQAPTDALVPEASADVVVVPAMDTAAMIKWV